MKTVRRHLRGIRWKGRRAKILAWALVFAFLMPSANEIFAREGEQFRDNLCIHHPEHTQECGYAAPEEGLCNHEHDENCGYIPPTEEGVCSHGHDEDCGYAAPKEEDPCNHVHDDTCGYIAPKEGSDCSHEHDENCGYQEAVEEIPCDLGCTETDDEGNIIHQPDCAYTPAQEGADCTHEHDESCGYREATEGSGCAHEHDENCGYAAPKEGSDCTHEHDENCGYIAPAEEGVCTHEHDETCGFKEPGEGSECGFLCEFCVNDWSWDDEEGLLIWNEDEKLWGLGVPGTDEENPLTRELLAEQLPESVTAQTPAGSRTAGLLWTFDEFPESSFEGEYTLTASLDGDYVLTEDAPALQVLVALGEGDELEDKKKFLNQWSFIAPNGTKLEKNEITVEIEDLSNKTRDDVIDLLKNSALPKLIRGWTTGSGLDDVLTEMQFFLDADQDETTIETKADGDREFTAMATIWCCGGISWEKSTFPSEFKDGDTFVLKAEIPTVNIASDTYNVYVNSNNSKDHADGKGDTRNNPDILSLTVTLKENNDRAKYLNRWSYVARDESKLDEDETVSAAIADMGNRSSDEIIKWLKDTVLPLEIRGWTSVGSVSDPNNVLEKMEFKEDKEWKEEKRAMTATGWSSEYTGDSYKWGRVKIHWKDESFPSEFVEGKVYTLQAEIPTIKQDPITYNIYVNSNKDTDYIGADGKPSEAKKDTKTKPEILSLNVSVHNIDLSGHTVTPASPGNVTVNLFDYWVKEEAENPSAENNGDILEKSDWHLHEEGGQGSPSTTTASYSTVDDWNKGINEKHLLLFGDGMIHAGLWNKGAGENCRYGNTYAGMEGIVKNVLPENGFPELNLKMANKVLTGDKTRDEELIKDYKLTGDHDDTFGQQYNSTGIKNFSNTVIGTWGGDIDNGTESLQYLFDPEQQNAYKRSYTDVTGLFQLDNKGYYYYNMRENFAEFSQEGGSNHFVLYDAPATIRTDGNQSVGNFFPFNKGYEVFNGVDGSKRLTSSVFCANNAMNHHLGMTVDVEFRQPANGTINTAGGIQPMTFEFAGDDDVWVFIDDVLVLDLGGIHSELYGTIDFSTGDIYIGRAFGTHGIPSDPAGSGLVTKTSLLAEYQNAHKEGDTAWTGNTFASNTSHTLKMFYLERGNYDSSIALRFNLQPLLYQRIAKVDQNGQSLPGVKFELYPAAEADEGEGTIRCLYTDSGDRGKTFFVRPDYSKSLVTLQTDQNGSAVFLTPDGSYFNFADRGDQYYVLKEVETGNGYRTQPIDIVLHYDSAASMLSVANRWTTGAYACSVSHVTSPIQINYGEMKDGMVASGSDIVGIGDKAEGLVVAVPLLQKKSSKAWLALHGSNLSGFFSVPIAGNGENDWERAALQAALEQAGANDTADWHLDWDEGNQRLYGTLNDLPGLANRYQLNDPNGDMHMVYGILSAQTLKNLSIHGNTAKERYASLREYCAAHTAEEACAALGNGFRLLSVDQFNRDFRSLIYIPNERRELWVMKVDQDGAPLQGTEFGLFNDEGCTAMVASGVTDRGGMLIFSPSGNQSEGEAQMIWANSTNTRYYLKEIKAPAGYELNDTVVPVIVGTYSIYADAGGPDDGVSVMAGVGRLTQTMRQYAMESDVDVTLQDITAFMQTQPGKSFQLTGWQDVKEEGTGAVRSMNLHFGRNAEVDYGLHDEDGGRLYKPFFVTETDFVRARVEQNYEALIGNQYEGASVDVNKDNLGDTDLTNLFSLLNIVVVTDRIDTESNTGRLSVSKKLTGQGMTQEDHTREFTFVLELKDAQGNPMDETLKYRIWDGKQAGYISSGGEIFLHSGESVIISGLPAGTKYTVTERQEEGWYVTPASGTVSGEIIRNETAVAEFVNSREKPEDDDEGKDNDQDEGEDGDGEEQKPPADSQEPAEPLDKKHPSFVNPSMEAAALAAETAAGAAGQTPDTGDEGLSGLWLMLGGISLAGLAVIYFTKLRKKKTSGEKDTD
ncbi:MAG: fibro-slime domain-containing protein [Lachnospiraceae bacterium]|nr:fibro-slime domain-containing protein [Lachnospiraceae bacterium]